MTTRIDIFQGAIVENREAMKTPSNPAHRLYRKPVIIRGTPDQLGYGAALNGTIDIYYDRDDDPQIYIMVSDNTKIHPINNTVDHPKEDTTGRITYVYVDQAARVPPPSKRNPPPGVRWDRKKTAHLAERLQCPCPALVRRQKSTSHWGHHVRVVGESTIVYSLCEPLRGPDGKTGVRLWLETESSNVKCIKTVPCCCSEKTSIQWPWLCPLLRGLLPPDRTRTLPDTLAPEKRPNWKTGPRG